LVPVKSTGGDGRAFLDQHHQHAVLFFQAHVLEEAGRVQRLDGGDALVVVEGLADAHRQVAEHRAGFGTLDAFDADVLDDEGLDCERRPAHSARTAAPISCGERMAGKTIRM
jgi:hypothetical protein